MAKAKILVTGATGRLGKYIVPELEKYFDVDGVGRKDWDLIYPIPPKQYDLVLHLAAYTNVQKAEEEFEKCFMTNVFGTYQLTQLYKDVPFVYLSTEYAKDPIGVYALTKQLGEQVVMNHKKHLILRTSFKPNPWPFTVAYVDQYTQGDYVDVIAKLVAETVAKWSRESSALMYVGTGRKTMFELAQRTKPDVIPNTIAEYEKVVGNTIIPRDYE